jgi:outer membrane scaffolding protein for murein synthesis (MipA/OmpV family)
MSIPRSLAAWMMGLITATTLFADSPESNHLFLRNHGIDGLKLNAGLMALRVSNYPGSLETRTLPYPIFFGEYKERIVFGASRFGVGGGAGWRLIHKGPWSWNLGAEGVESRPESRAAALAGMGNRAITFFTASGVEYNKGPLVFVAALRQGLNEGAGLGGVVRANVYLPFGKRWLLEITALAHVYDERQMRWEFGISPLQAQRRALLISNGDRRITSSELGAYEPGGGLSKSLLGLSLGYALTPHLRLGLSVNRENVHGRALSSPLAKQHGNLVGALGVSYQL